MRAEAQNAGRVMLFIAGAVAFAVGLGLLMVPRMFYASYGIDLGHQPSLLSEIRAPGALLVAIALVLVRCALSAHHRAAAAGVGAAFYLSYATGRLLSTLLDGTPHLNLLYAGAAELVLGLGCAWVYWQLGERGARTRAY